MAIVTRHGRNRMKRIGLSKSLAQTQADKALEFGLRHVEATGPLKRYMDHVFLSHRNADNMRVYHGSLYIFCGDVLITIYTLDNDKRRIAEKLEKRKTPA